MVVRSWKKNTHQDRISELPDSLLIYILSLLDNMKYAVRTGLLSNRWKNLWTNLDTLVYNNCVDDIENPSKKDQKQFMLFVDKTLMQCTCPKIKKLCLVVSRFDEKVSPFLLKLVDKWIDFVIDKNVQVFKFGLNGLDYKIPVSFFRGSSFVSLEVDGVGKHYYFEDWEPFTSLVSLKRCRLTGTCNYIKTFDVSWKMLKSLTLKRIDVTNEFLAEILLGCPILETMVLDGVGGLNVINISSPSLRELKLINFGYNDENFTRLDITAPWVEKLEVSGCFHQVECNLVTVTSLKCACLTFSHMTFDCLEHFKYEDDYDNDSDEYGSNNEYSENDSNSESSEDNSDNESYEDESNNDSYEEESDNDSSENESDNGSDEDDFDNESDEDESDDDSDADDSDNDEEHYGFHEEEWFNMIDGLLEPVCNVDELVVGAELLQALSMLKLLNRDSLLFNCKRVTLQSPICIHAIPGIVELLESSPYLETLIIKLMPWQCCHIHGERITEYMKKVFPSFSGVDYLSEQKGAFPCLKNVMIYCAEKHYSCCDGGECNKNTFIGFELKVVAHIVRNTDVLEKMVIFSDCSDYATRYVQLMSSEEDVGDKAAGWDLKKRKSTYEFRFPC